MYVQIYIFCVVKIFLFCFSTESNQIQIILKWILPTDGTGTDTMTLGLSGSGSNGNIGVEWGLYITHIDE